MTVIRLLAPALLCAAVAAPVSAESRYNRNALRLAARRAPGH